MHTTSQAAAGDKSMANLQADWCVSRLFLHEDIDKIIKQGRDYEVHTICIGADIAVHIFMHSFVQAGIACIRRVPN